MDQEQSLKKIVIDFVNRLFDYFDQQKLTREDFKKGIDYLKPLLIGLVLSIGGFSLFLGALTQGVSWILSRQGVTLIPSIFYGFLLISTLVMASGGIAIKVAYGKLSSLVKN